MLLKGRPDVFLTYPKELRFFAKEGAPDFRGPGDDEAVNRNWVTSWDDYCGHFATVNGEKAIGEASPFYLCSEEAPRRIRTFLPDAKLIVVLRDPVERAFSSFMYIRRWGWEPLADFSQALELEDRRRRDNWEYLWQYRKLGLYGAQIERYLNVFPREQISIDLFDELESDPIDFTRSLCAFLGIDSDFRPRIPDRVNMSGRPRSRVLQRIVDRQNAIRSLARYVVPKPYRKSIRVALTQNNLQQDDMPCDVEKDLRAFYRPDIERLEGLIGRDLSAWRRSFGWRYNCPVRE